MAEQRLLQGCELAAASARLHMAALQSCGLAVPNAPLPKPAKVAVIPIHIKEKPIGLFYMDWAAGETTDMSFQFAKDLRKIISAAFQTLILAKKLGV